MKTKESEDLIYSRLAPRVGHDVAVFCICAVTDVEYDPDVEAGSWAEYKASAGGCFEDGETDINAAILAGMPTQERWETVWGDGYSESDYKQLDELYRTMTSQLDSTGGIDRQQEDTARTCAMMALEHRKLIRKADKDSVAMAKQYDQMIRENLKDSNMRKADILPTQAQRLDGFVDALQKQGLTPEMTEEDVFSWFYRKCKQKKYEMTTDAADWMLLSILKTMAKNDDMPEPYELEEDMSLAAFESEFASEPNEDEQAAYEYLGIVRGGATRQKGSDENGDASDG